MKEADTTIFGNAAETRDDFKELIEQLNESTKNAIEVCEDIIGCSNRESKDFLNDLLKNKIMKICIIAEELKESLED